MLLSQSFFQKTLMAKNLCEVARHYLPQAGSINPWAEATPAGFSRAPPVNPPSPISGQPFDSQAVDPPSRFHQDSSKLLPVHQWAGASLTGDRYPASVAAPGLTMPSIYLTCPLLLLRAHYCFSSNQQICFSRSFTIIPCTVHFIIKSQWAQAIWGKLASSPLSCRGTNGQDEEVLASCDREIQEFRSRIHRISIKPKDTNTFQQRCLCHCLRETHRAPKIADAEKKAKFQKSRAELGINFV